METKREQFSRQPGTTPHKTERSLHLSICSMCTKKPNGDYSSGPLHHFREQKRTQIVKYEDTNQHVTVQFHLIFQNKHLFLIKMDLFFINFHNLIKFVSIFRFENNIKHKSHIQPYDEA